VITFGAADVHPCLVDTAGQEVPSCEKLGGVGVLGTRTVAASPGDAMNRVETGMREDFRRC
jgi:hypothetical protein